MKMEYDNYEIASINLDTIYLFLINKDSIVDKSIGWYITSNDTDNEHIEIKVYHSPTSSHYLTNLVLNHYYVKTKNITINKLCRYLEYKKFNQFIKGEKREALELFLKVLNEKIKKADEEGETEVTKYLF